MWEFAVANEGRYDIDAHLKHDPSASEAFAETHVRRLEAMRRVIRSVEREPDGTWIIAADHLDKAAAFEARQRRDRPVTLETLSAVSPARMPHTDAATWPDTALAAGATEPLTAAGSGRRGRASRSPL